MADFISDLQSFKQSFSFLDIDPTMESLNQFTELKALNYQSFLPLSFDNFFNNNQALEIPSNWEDNNLPGFTHHSNNCSMSVAQSSIIDAAKTELHESKKRKALLDVSESGYGNPSSLRDSESGINRRNNSGRGKRAKSNENKEEKPKEVVHVRARRGQATDSHSLAERVRRGKINERLRCLQDIVPGCYKTMGMAVMLDQIISYVRSLQKQVEFLSMKLTAASTHYDFNSESDDLERMQREKAEEAIEFERWMQEVGYVGWLA